MSTPITLNLKYCKVILITLLCLSLHALSAQDRYKDEDIISSIKKYNQLAIDSINTSIKLRLFLDSAKFYLNQIQYENKQKVEVREHIQRNKILEAIYAKGVNDSATYLDLLDEMKNGIFLLPNRNLIDSMNMGIIFRHLAAYYGRTGDLEKQKTYDAQAELWHPTLASKYAYLAAQFLRSENYNKAILCAKKSLKNATPGKGMYESTCYMISNCYILENNADSAQHYLDLHDFNSSFSPTEYTVRKSQIFCLNEDFKKALEVVNQQLNEREKKLSFKTKFDRYTSKLFIERGEIYFRQGQLQSALKDFQKGIVYLLPDFTSENPIDNPVIKSLYTDTDILNAFNKKIKALNSLREKEESYSDLCLKTTIKAMDLMDLIRKNIMADEDQQFLVRKSYRNYQTAFELAILKNDIQQAFNISERSKGITLYDKLIANLTAYHSEENNTLGKINKLKQRLIDNKGLLLTADKEKSRLIESEIKDTEIELDDLSRELERRPEVRNILNQLEITSFEDVKKGLGDDQVMIHFFETEQHFYAFLFGKNSKSPKVEKIPLSAPLREALKNLNYNIDKKQDSLYTRDAHFIYQELFYKPFFKEQSLPERLIIVPDGILNNLAFDALLLEPAESVGDFKTYDYWGTNVAWAIWPSASIGLNFLNQNIEHKHPYKLLAYAPAFDEERADSIRAVDTTTNLPYNLIFNENEIDAIDNTLAYPDIQVLALKEYLATKEHFLAYCEDASIIHIASHAVALGQKNSYITFSNIQDSMNYKLTIDDIYLLNLSAELMFTSACETGVGDQVTGEGVMSLSRALMYAGSKSVIHSLWEVDDVSTMKLNIYFYKELKKGMPKDIAMKNAKKTFIEKAASNDHAHPKYWSSLALNGSAAPLFDDEKNNGYCFLGKILGFLLFFMLCFFSIRAYRRFMITDDQ